MQIPQTTIDQEFESIYEDKQVDDAYAQKAKDVAEDPESFYFDNLAETLKEDDLQRIFNEVIQGFENDDDSISELKEFRMRYNKMFDLTHEETHFPWENSANIRLPNLTKACIQFASRAGLNSEQGEEIVKIDPVASDEESFLRAKNVSLHFNHQLKFSKPNHYLSHRKTRMQLARDGYAFRKVYWDSMKKQVVSEHILPEDFVVNYYSRSLETCYRYTHILKMNENQIKLKMAQKIYREADISELSHSDVDQETELSNQNMGVNVPDDDFTTVRDVLECHTYIYLKESDELRIPVIVTVDKDSEQVLRIVRRSHPETGEPMHYFTNYEFIPNDKSIYGYGFGNLLYNIVSAMNAATNQMINAGTLQTTATGIVSKHMGLKGAKSMKMAEFLVADGRVDDLKKHFMQLSFAAPSQVLLSLLQYLGEQADQLSTITEIMVGQQKSDTTATSATIAQQESLKLFTDIQKAYHTTLGHEFQCMKMMYSIFLDETQTVDIQGVQPFQITRQDYRTNLTILPVADPNVMNQQKKVGQAEYLLNNVIKQDPFLSQSPDALFIGTSNLLEAMGTSPKLIDSLQAIYAQTVQQQQQAQQLAQQQAQQAQQAQQLESDLAETDQKEQEQRENLEQDLAEIENQEEGGEA
tara:strand:+ start:2325 stop:4244 length:1920 start_codon:yes stop_codon:yes gene_type:complete